MLVCFWKTPIQLEFYERLDVILRYYYTNLKQICVVDVSRPESGKKAPVMLANAIQLLRLVYECSALCSFRRFTPHKTLFHLGHSLSVLISILFDAPRPAKRIFTLSSAYVDGFRK